MSTSQLQQHTMDELRLLLQACIVEENYRPDWLKNPKTGRNLELDFYLPDLEMAIEVQGQQHIQRIPFFHETEDDFHRCLVYDRYKRLKCLDRGLELFEVFAPNDIPPFLEQAKTRNAAVAEVLSRRACAMRSLSYYAAEIGRLRHTDQKRVAKCVNHMIHICEKYDIPLVSVRPDFTIRKMEMSFFGKSIVKVHHIWFERIVDGERAALMRWDFDTAICVCRWHSKEFGEQYVDMEFDMCTGREVGADEPYWQITPSSWPESLLLQMYRKGIRVPAQLEMELVNA